MQTELQSNCFQCFGLCCVALPYSQSADFPYDKASGEPCRNLNDNFLCSVHDQLAERGFRGCVSYECFGAGQKVSQQIYDGQDWRRNPKTAEGMFRVFPIVQQLHEMLVYLHQCLQLDEVSSFRTELEQQYKQIEELTVQSPTDMLTIDVAYYRLSVSGWLEKASIAYRAKKRQMNRLLNKKGIDCIEADLSNMNLYGESFRGRLMIATNFTKSDLRRVDFLGADLRNAHFHGANLSEALFLTQSQLNAARGDQATVIPDHLVRPMHWY
ncbi:hypothetical protein DH09_12190 [Bacillaceae bacterium JMAK1]|nr:hypothetical protein DH09_12190 [Bacillaceae bacterium JMAK1]